MSNCFPSSKREKTKRTHLVGLPSVGLALHDDDRVPLDEEEDLVLRGGDGRGHGSCRWMMVVRRRRRRKRFRRVDRRGLPRGGHGAVDAQRDAKGPPRGPRARAQEAGGGHPRDEVFSRLVSLLLLLPPRSGERRVSESERERGEQRFSRRQVDSFHNFSPR